MFDTIINSLSVTECCLIFVAAVVITFVVMMYEETK